MKTCHFCNSVCGLSYAAVAYVPMVGLRHIARHDTSLSSIAQVYIQLLCGNTVIVFPHNN
jgi:hypothetical protein